MNMEINPSEYKVLIVDDVISNVLLLKVLLTNEKFNIVTAGNGTQALEQVKKEKPDLVLLDVMMPDISGFEVAQQMKADPEMSEIPIIFLTALNSTADIVNSYISSPIVSLGRFRINIFSTILIDPIGERRSCAITE